jgi:7,8-dihydroneopterin aldolase/epimerase/oxygenase
MPLADQSSIEVDTATTAIIATKVFVRGLRIDAEIGIHDHEQGRKQPLMVDVELDVSTDGWRALDDTVNYESIAAAARFIAAAGHIGLVESFAQRLASRCLAHPRVTRARVRVEKPLALAPDAAAAGVEITAVRG